MLINLNLPAAVRYQRKIMLLVGFTPGPNNPKDLDSFLWPLIEEFMELEKGVNCWNAATETYIPKLHAYITVVGADMVGREKIMKLKGKSAWRTLRAHIMHHPISQVLTYIII